MAWVKHTFMGLNQDIDPRLLKPEMMRDALNIRTHTGEDGFAGSMQSVMGNRDITNLVAWDHDTSSWAPAELPAGDSYPIACFEDKAGESVYVLLYNSQSNHLIYRHEESTNQTKILIQSPVLGFRPNGYAQGGIVGRVLSFTDGFNQPRAIDVEAIYRVKTILPAMISMPRPRPTLPPTPLAFEDAALKYRMARQSVVFSYRFVFKDGTASVWSDYSRLVNTWYDTGASAARKVTRIALSFLDRITLDASGPLGENAWTPLIDKVEVACRIGQDGGLNEAGENITNPFRLIAREPFPLTSLEFRNDQNYDAVPDDQILKPFDSAPIKARAMVAVRNRVMLSGTTEGYDAARPNFQRQADIEVIPPSSGAAVLKSGAEYQFGVQFEDDYGRSAGVSTSDLLRLSIPSWGPSGPFPTDPLGNPFRGIKFTMYGQPPEWATSYSIVRTDTLNKSDWMQFRMYDKGYAETKRFGILEVKWYSDEEITTEVDGPEHEDANFIGLPIGYRLKAGFGFEILNGDLVTIQGYGDPSVELEVVGLNAGTAGAARIVARWQRDIEIHPAPRTGYPTGTRLCEVFRPRKQSSVEPFYKIGISYPVLNPGTPQRAYSQPVIEIKSGDSYWVRERQEIYGSLMHENPTPVLARAAQRDLETGRASVVLRESEQKFRPTAYRWSNPLIQESNINGVCNFEAANQEILPYELGAAVGLALAANSQAEGTVVLGLHERDVSSIYTEQGIVQTGDGGVLSSTSNSFFAGHRVLKSETGCQHPGSIASEDGRVYWFDAASGAVCMYSQAGVSVISDRGMRRYFRDAGKNTMALGAQARVAGGFDEYNREYILSIGAVGQPKLTVAFSEIAEAWVSFYSYSSEAYGKLSNRFYSFLGGRIYRHDNPTPNQFFGSAHESRAQVAVGYGEGVVLPSAIALQSNIRPYQVDAETIEGQATSIFEDDFSFRENVWYHPFYRDIHTPAPGDATGIATGDRIRSEATLVTIRYKPTKPLRLISAVIQSILSSGHQALR